MVHRNFASNSRLQTHSFINVSRPMKLHVDNTSGLNLFTSYGPGFVAVNHNRYERNLLVLPEQVELDWTLHDFASLTEGDFSKLAKLGADVILLGTGHKLRFPHPSLQAPLMAAGIGLEIMDTTAACRTYNILASEGRKAAAALLVEAP